MTYYLYKLNSWQICVNAVSKKDASEYIKIHDPGAICISDNYTPPTWRTPTPIIAGAVTEKMQAIIREEINRDMAEWFVSGCPGRIEVIKI